MRRDTAFAKEIKSSFLSCEKDAETILKKLFVTSKPYSEELKKLLLINTKDCLDNSNKSYQEIAENTSVKELLEGKYISLVPRIKMKEHEEVKSYIILTFDDFTETSNPEFRDCIISFDILCHGDCWELENYQIRPLKIAGIIDGILNDSKLSGIGQIQFHHMQQLMVRNDLIGYSLLFRSVHGSDDRIPPEE